MQFTHDSLSRALTEFRGDNPLAWGGTTVPFACDVKDDSLPGLSQRRAEARLATPDAGRRDSVGSLRRGRAASTLRFCSVPVRKQIYIGASLVQRTCTLTWDVRGAWRWALAAAAWRRAKLRRLVRGLVAIGFLAGTACGSHSVSSPSASSPDSSIYAVAVADAIVDIALDRSSLTIDQSEQSLNSLGSEFRATPELDDTDWIGSVGAILKRGSVAPDGIIRIQLTGEPSDRRVMRIEASFLLADNLRRELSDALRAGFERHGVPTVVNVDGPPDYIGNIVDPASQEGRHIQVIMTPTVAVLRVWPAYVR